MNKKSLYIIATVIVSSIIMSIVDGIIQPTYFYKSCFKIVLFMIVPLLYFLVFKDEWVNMKELFIPKKNFKKSLLLGIGVYVVIMAAYLIFKNFIDFNGIVDSLTGDVGVNADNFLFVAIYISFVNSLLEEFFFRGYAFILLNKQMNKIIAYVFSAGLFAFYHVGMTFGWFNIWIYVLAMLGLFIGGVIFNYLNDKFGNIYSSWLVHMFANFAINTIGCILFGIL